MRYLQWEGVKGLKYILVTVGIFLFSIVEILCCQLAIEFKLILETGILFPSRVPISFYCLDTCLKISF